MLRRGQAILKRFVAEPSQPSGVWRSGAGIRTLLHSRPALSCRTASAALFFLAYFPLYAQTIPWSVRVASALVARTPQGEKPPAWNDQAGLELEGLAAAWYNTANGDYFQYVRRTIDASLGAVGNAQSPGTDDPRLARQLLLLYRVTLAPQYYEAAKELQHRLSEHCFGPASSASSPVPQENVSEPPCTAQPFLAEYAAVFHQPRDFAPLTRSFDLWQRQIETSSPRSGPASAAAHSRDTQLAWLTFALIDTLPNYPHDDPGRVDLIARFNRLATGFLAHQDRQTGRFKDWSAAKTPLLAPTACLLIYALEKGVRLGYLPVSDLDPAERAWHTISTHALRVAADGSMQLASDPPQSAAVQGYVTNLGPLLLAATEADHTATATQARGETVMLDAWYNSQLRKNAAGEMVSFHYKWDDWSDSGYSLLGHIFRNHGAMTETLPSEPTQKDLSRSQFYLIVSPDIPVKNPNPRYMTAHDADEIAAWVKQGGVLVMMENDPPNADIAHLNLLADRFGIHFDDVLHHHILGEHIEDGRMPVTPDGRLFHESHTLYMKDTCAISLRSPAESLFRDRGDVVMATAKYGRGTVFAAVDPWLYNEYTDGRKNPHIYNEFDNFAGGEEFVQWLLQQRPR